MNNAPLIIKQSDLDEIAAQLRIHGTSSVKIAILETINQGRLVQITENGAVVFETKSCDEFENHLRTRAQPVPEDSSLLKNRNPTKGPTSGSLEKQPEKI
jgi:hypothetical protein